MNFFGMAPSGIAPNSLRKGPFSKLTFKQSAKQCCSFPKSANWSTLKGNLILSVVHLFQHDREVCLTCWANLSARKVDSISACSAMRVSASTWCSAIVVIIEYN